MKRTIAPLPLSVILSMTGFMLGAASAAGQGAAGPGGTSSAAGQPAPNTTIEAQMRAQVALQRGPTVTLDFPGGTLTGYLEAVTKAAAPSPVNILTNPEAGAQDCPPIRLTGVSVDTALRSVCNVLFLRGWSADAQSMAREGDTVPTFFLKAFPPSGYAGAAKTELRVFSVRDLVEPPPGLSGEGLSVPMDTVTSALLLVQDQSAVKGQPAEIKMHDRSGTLLVRGTKVQIEQVEQLLETMKSDITARRNSALSLSERSAARAAADEEAQAQLRGLEAALESMQRAATNAQAEVSQAEALLKEGAVTPHEVDTKRQQLANIESQLLAQRLEHDRVRAMAANTARSRGGAGGGATTIAAPDALLVIYDARDLKARMTELNQFFQKMRTLACGDLPRVQVFSPDGGKNNAPGSGVDDSASPNLIIVATREQHAVIAHVLKMLRDGTGANVVEQKE